MNVALIGYRCSGKTTVSHALACSTGWFRLESDALIEERLGMSIPEIVRRYGWPLFRRNEERVVIENLTREETIFDLGGGVVLNSSLMEGVRRRALVVFLACPQGELARRLGESFHRPALTTLDPSAELRRTLAERLPLYRRYAHLTIDTRRHSATKCAGRILDVLSTFDTRRVPAFEVSTRSQHIKEAS